MIKTWLSSLLVTLFFLALSLCLYRQLLGGVMTWGDGPYFFPQNWSNYLSTWGDYQGGVSNAGLMFGIPYIGSLPKIFSVIFGSNDALISNILYITPVALTSLAMCYFSKKLTGSGVVGVFSGLVIIVNNFIIEQIIVFPGHFFFNYISLITLFYLLLSYRKSPRFKSILIILNSILIGHPTFLLMYLIIIFLFLFSSLSTLNRSEIMSIVFANFSILIVHCYWIVPFISNLLSTSSSLISGNNADAVYGGLKMTVSYIRTFLFKNYSGDLRTSFYSFTSIIYYFSIIFTAFVWSGNKKIEENTRFLGLVFVVFMLVGLGPKSVIVGSLFEWMYKNVTGFSYLRSFTRFLLPAWISLCFLLAINIKYKRYLLIFLTPLLFVAHLDFFSGNLNNHISSFNIPNEYYKANQIFQENYSDGKVLILPNSRYESYLWSANNGKNINEIYFNFLFFNRPVIFNGDAYHLETKSDSLARIFNFNYVDEKKSINQFFDDLETNGIQYVMVKKDLFDILSKTKIDYIKVMSHMINSKYKLIEDNNYYSLFIGPYDMRMIEGNGITYSKISNTLYKITVHNLSDKSEIIFKNSYHDGWKLIPINKTSSNSFDNNFISQLRLILLPAIGNEYHIRDENYNKWLLNKNNIITNFDVDIIKSDMGEPVSVELMLAFIPQSLFYLGSVISIVSILVIIIFGVTIYKKEHAQ